MLILLSNSVQAEDLSPRIWSNYVETVRGIISDKWRPRGFLESYYAEISFELNSDGSLRDIDLDKKSTNREFDTYAMDTIKLSAPFPHFPDGAHKPIRIKYYFDFHYKIED